tara:strand:+ start:26110 stop:27891 length:1782 start_codon:yes stop_codon:yes gene_type:complete
MGSETAELGVKAGSIVAGTYEIVRMLGRGGMGAVWEAHHTRLPGKRVAIKVLHASVAEDPEALARFRREAEIACRLGHPNIVEVHDFNKLEDGSPYLILELLEGTSLDEHLRHGPLGIEECEAYVRQIAAALQSAHAQGVVHRDLKPQNIFLIASPSGVGPAIAKVLDFGISKIRGSETVKTLDSTLLGTPQYMAPEQAVGQHDSVDGRTDIFALGAMVYELLSGKPAFGGQNIPEVVYKVVHVAETPLVELLPNIPPEKAAAVHKALSKAQDDRFQTVAEMVLAFTGEPLPSERSRNPSIPAHQKSGVFASAATVDSSKLDIASAATLDSRNMNIGQAATVASQSTELPALGPSLSNIEAAETIDSSKLERNSVLPPSLDGADTQADSPPAASRRMPWKPLVGIALLAVGLGGFALTRGGNESKTKPVATTPIKGKVKAAQPQPLGAGAPPMVDASAPIVDASMVQSAVPADAAPDTISNPHTAQDPVVADAAPKKKPISKPEPAVKPDEKIPPNVATLLDEAESHLKAKRFGKVITTSRAANRLHPTPRGYMLQAAAFCQNGDLPAFNGALRKLPAARRKAAKAACERQQP